MLLSFSQAKRRLELEAGYPQELKNGGGAAKAKKPMASLSHSEGKSKTVLYFIFFNKRCSSAGQ